MNSDQLLLIDYSLLSRIIYETSGNEPDPNYVSNQIVARVRALSAQHPHAAICCDAPPYLRKEIDPTYKATRPEGIAPLLHQMTLAAERLAAEGYPIWRVRGYEADDIIATAVKQALAIDGVTVLIASSDKDLLQLVGPRVTMKKLTGDYEIVDEAGVVAKFGITPPQVLDYLCLVGDTSDNIQGAKGIGGVRAAALLKAHGTLAAVYAAMKEGVVPGMTPSQRTALVDFEPRWPVVRELITLREDVAIPFEEIAAERTVAAMTADEESAEMGEGPDWKPDETDRELTGAEATAAVSKAFAQATNGLGQPIGIGSGVMAAPPEARNAALDIRAHEQQRLAREIAAQSSAVGSYLVPSTPVDFSQQLEPRNMDDAVKLAQRMFESRLFSAYGTPQAVLATVLAGRELGIPAMASLRAFHIIEGKPTLSAGIIQSLVLKSGKARYFRCSERTDQHATFVTKRGDDPEMALTFTVAEARRAFGFAPGMDAKSEAEKERKWQASGWGKNPADNCVARASSKLARLVYPDVVSGLYAPEEME